MRFEFKLWPFWFFVQLYSVELRLFIFGLHFGQHYNYNRDEVVFAAGLQPPQMISHNGQKLIGVHYQKVVG
jgi:hypothetical protein